MPCSGFSPLHFLQHFLPSQAMSCSRLLLPECQCPVVQKWLLGFKALMIQQTRRSSRGRCELWLFQAGCFRSASDSLLKWHYRWGMAWSASDSALWPALRRKGRFEVVGFGTNLTPEAGDPLGIHWHPKNAFYLSLITFPTKATDGDDDDDDHHHHH